MATFSQPVKSRDTLLSLFSLRPSVLPPDSNSLISHVISSCSFSIPRPAPLRREVKK